MDDLVEGIYHLTHSDLERPAIIGGGEYVTVDELVAKVAGKEIHKNHIEGPVGVQARNFDKSRIKSLGWGATTSLKEGIAETYAWIEEQVKATYGKENHG